MEEEMILYIAAWFVLGVFNWLVMFPMCLKYCAWSYDDNMVIVGFILSPMVFVIGCFALIVDNKFGTFHTLSNFSKKLWKL